MTWSDNCSRVNRAGRALVVVLVAVAVSAGCKSVFGVPKERTLENLKSKDRDVVVKAVRDVPYIRGAGKPEQYGGERT